MKPYAIPVIPVLAPADLDRMFARLDAAEAIARRKCLAHGVDPEGLDGRLMTAITGELRPNWQNPRFYPVPAEIDAEMAKIAHFPRKTGETHAASPSEEARPA